MGRYAADTEVSPEASRAEIERTLERWGAEQFAYGRDDSQAMAVIMFRMQGRQVRVRIPLPRKDSREFTHTPGRNLERSREQALAEWQKACRQRWRACALIVKAKLEAIEAGISTLEDEFLSHIVLPDGRTYGEYAVPQIETAYRTARMPPLLPWSGGCPKEPTQ